MKPIQRRAFLRNAGVAVAATTVATTAAATMTAASSTPSDQSAIQQLHRAFVARLNNRQYEDLPALFAGEAPLQTPGSPVYLLGDAQHLDAITVAPDQQRATARFHCRARLESALSSSSSSSLVEMARQQGQGVIQWWESGVLDSEYVKVASLWKIARVSFRAYNELRNATNSSF